MKIGIGNRERKKPTRCENLFDDSNKEINGETNNVWNKYVRDHLFGQINRCIQKDLIEIWECKILVSESARTRIVWIIRTKKALGDGVKQIVGEQLWVKEREENQAYDDSYIHWNDL